tara:strand:- start:1942 stop:4431 length:2490 start_codon:yes stop_codon:yes gene_type:complete
MRYSFLALTSTCLAVLPLYNSAHAQLLTGYEGASLQKTPKAKAAPQDFPAVEVTPLESPKPIVTPVANAPVRPSPIIKGQDGRQSYRPLMTYEIVPQRTTEPAAPVEAAKTDDAVDLQADDLSYDESTEVVTARGDVFLQQTGRILRADQVRYEVAKDRVSAAGNVVLNDNNGDVHLADHGVYQDKLQNADVENLRSTLNDGSRFKAKSGEMRDGVTTTMNDAHYTPCAICGDDPDEVPAWAIRSSAVTHHKDEQRISYKNARFEAWGVPVAYVPYFSHPDGSIEQKSGFLSPTLGYRSDLGAFIEQNYYWAISPDQDATFGIMAMTNQAPLGLLEYRKRWNEAILELEGGITHSDRSDRSSGITTKEGDKLRGHIFANALWDINEEWRTGFDLQYTSDDQYMRQYDFTNEDVLESQIYAERFSGRDYASARLISFQDIRVRDEVTSGLDQPDVLPEVIASFIGEPGDIPYIAGRWSADFSILGLRREGDEQDVNRFSLDLGWKRRFVSDFGLVATASTSVRGDAYHTNDRTSASAGSGLSRSGTETRVFPMAHVETSYPIARQFDNVQATISPIFSITAAPKMDDDDYPNIPNEDSNDVQIDSSNLFQPSRFPGLDRLEDQSHLTYGLRTGLYGNEGSFGEVFIGQSYRLDERENPFPFGSGLSDQGSDVVGQVSGSYKDIYTLDYRYQLGSRHLTSRRHEISASADWNRFYLNSEYLFSKALDGTELDESREQITADAAFYFTPNWRTRSGAVHDFGENSGLRSVYTSLDYLGQCLYLSLTGEKSFASEASGESGTELFFRIGLKNLGEFEETSYKPNGESDSACSF